MTKSSKAKRVLSCDPNAFWRKAAGLQGELYARHFGAAVDEGRCSSKLEWHLGDAFSIGAAIHRLHRAQWDLPYCWLYFCLHLFCRFFSSSLLAMLKLCSLTLQFCLMCRYCLMWTDAVFPFSFSRENLSFVQGEELSTETATWFKKITNQWLHLLPNCNKMPLSAPRMPRWVFA